MISVAWWFHATVTCLPFDVFDILWWRGLGNHTTFYSLLTFDLLLVSWYGQPPKSKEDCARVQILQLPRNRAIDDTHMILHRSSMQKNLWCILVWLQLDLLGLMLSSFSTPQKSLKTWLHRLYTLKNKTSSHKWCGSQTMGDEAYQEEPKRRCLLTQI